VKIINLMLVCGEPSGDALGAQLMAGIKQLAGDRVRFTGVGGLAMAREGLKSLYPLDTTAVMGLREVVPAIPAILRHVRQAVDFAVQTKPDAVVVIDSPDFTHRVARAIRKRDPSIPTVDYVAPQVWASRAYRAKAMASYFDLVLALFPFEVAFFEKYGLKAAFVGHPVIERAANVTGGEALRTRLGIAPDAPLLALLPGSRTSEIRFILPVFRAAVKILGATIPDLVTVLPTVPHVAGKVAAATQDSGRRGGQVRGIPCRERRLGGIGYGDGRTRAVAHPDGGSLSCRGPDLFPVQVPDDGEAHHPDQHSFGARSRTGIPAGPRHAGQPGPGCGPSVW